ncbi:acyl-CoA--sterol O-acyltransferase 1-like [Vicia villosa]|uniref:acyl-CoA--sterol O-acyltransferase 1-like n=1 Tax=Vicia villosa TaxID=3911 RepID=UPI00273A8E0F|nr:acyl-CoA--sterol O-acyltransferase 1-like [Vicia villosa]
MESNMLNLMKVYPLVFISLTYCFWIRSFVSPGAKRLFCLLPIICLNLFIPLTFTSVHLSGNLGFFLAWLANFKLLLFAFNKGPLSSDPSTSLPRFVALACLPIKIQQNNKNPDKPRDRIGQTPIPDLSKANASKSSNFTFLQYAIKFLLLGVLVKLYDYSDHIHPKVILGMYCFHIYFLLEIILAIVAAFARNILGLELEPQFNNPIISTSLQDFWGKRWNLMVTSILRPTVYGPTLKAAKIVVGSKWAPLPAVFGTFVVSGLMHELILFYMGRMEPTFRMFGFFVLHGVCLTVEIALKKVLTDRWRLPRLVSGPLTVGFVFGTCFWLFLPEFIRCRLDVMAFQEYAALGVFVKNVTSAF